MNKIVPIDHIMQVPYPVYVFVINPTPNADKGGGYIALRLGFE